VATGNKGKIFTFKPAKKSAGSAIKILFTNFKKGKVLFS
jgi:hypothetical protein